MPNERVSEPTLEQLSAYLDHELDPSTQARIAEHVAGCTDCQTRLDGLRQAAYAIRALPMETPPRAFTVPERLRQPRWRWAPAGWAASAAVAFVLIGYGVAHIQLGAPTLTTASKSISGGVAVSQQRSGAAAPQSGADQYARTAQAAGLVHSATVSDPRNSSRLLTVSTDAASYPSTGAIQLRISTTGLSASEASSVRLWLRQDRSQGGGYAINLSPLSSESTYPFMFTGAYSIQQMSIAPPIAGSYTILVQVSLSDGSSLIAELPLTISS